MNDRRRSREPLPIRLALGQLIVARYPGPVVPQSLLNRIRRGEVGGVILFADNISSVAQVRRQTSGMQRAARAGRNPVLLVMTDQEGGDVKRFASAPPGAAAQDIGSAAKALREGERTGRFLRSIGVNMNLAPVADVTANPSSFLGSRAYGDEPGTVADRACAFSRGLRSERVVATLKHFPGLGLAGDSTDLMPVTLADRLSEVRAGYAAYRRCANEPGTTVMMSSAAYASLTGSTPAVMSGAAYRDLRRTGSSAPTISDDLETPALMNLESPARRSVNAGLDLLLYARRLETSATAYERLLAAANAGELDRDRVRASALEVIRIKRWLK